MTADWIDDLLDRHPGEPVPEGFRSRLRARLGVPQVGHGASGPAQRRRPARVRWVALAMAAGLLLFAGGFWVGRGAPSLLPQGPAIEPETASLELVEIYRNQELLEAWPLVADGDLELGLFDASAGTWELDENGSGG